jgi:hypothetical protein
MTLDTTPWYGPHHSGAAPEYGAEATGSPFETIQAEAAHRSHAQVEQMFAGLASGSWLTWRTPRVEIGLEMIYRKSSVDLA